MKNPFELIQTIAYSYNKQLAFGSKNGVIIVFNTITRKCKNVLTKNFYSLGGVVTLKFSDDTKRLAVGYEFGMLKILETT